MEVKDMQIGGVQGAGSAVPGSQPSVTGVEETSAAFTTITLGMDFASTSIASWGYSTVPVSTGME